MINYICRALFLRYVDLLAKNQNLYARPVLSATGIDILIL